MKVMREVENIVAVAFGPETNVEEKRDLYETVSGV